MVLCYFLGQLAQVIPVPGGIGPVEGDMVAAFAACGVPIDLAVVSVVAYPAASPWLPAGPGLWGYLRLRRTVAAWREAAPRSPAKSASPRAVRRPRVKLALPARDHIGHSSGLAVARDCPSSNSTPGR